MAEFLPPGKRRAVALQYLPEYFKLGYTATRALESLRERGLGYRMQVFYRDWREMKEKQDIAELIRRLDPEERVPFAWRTETEWRISRRYQAVFDVTLWDIEHEEEIRRPFYLATDLPLTKGEAEARLAELIIEEESPPRVEIIELELVGWERRRPRRRF